MTENIINIKGTGELTYTPLLAEVLMYIPTNFIHHNTIDLNGLSEWIKEEGNLISVAYPKTITLSK